MNQITNYQETSTFLTRLLESKSLPTHIKNVEQAFTIVNMGKELGFAPLQSLHYIIPIQGKLSLSAKALNALLRKGNVKFITKEDGVRVYKDGTVSDIAREDEKPVDMRTTIIFYRDELEEVCSFTWKDAEKMGLTSKDNWSRMPKEMLYARCLSKGANRIGADLLLGLYTVDELADSFNIDERNIRRDEEGFVQELIEQPIA